MTNGTNRGSRGPAPNWKLGKTRTIRVPVVIADQMVKIAKKIDNGDLSPETLLTEPETLFTEEDKQELSKSP